MKFLGLLFLLSSLLIVTECRQGWKTSGNGFFIYNATTNFQTNNSLSIAGKFATKPGSKLNNVLIAVEDASGELAFQVSVDNEMVNSKVRQMPGIYQGGGRKVIGSTSGYVFDFKVTVTQKQSGASDWEQSVRCDPGVTTTVKSSQGWDLSKIKVYVAGYNQSVIAGDYFEGCLSNVVFQGTDIIATYFQQYPNNTNPVRGPITFGKFSVVAETCNDATSTPRPTSTTTRSATTPSGASSVGPLVHFTLLLGFFACLFK